MKCLCLWRGEHERWDKSGCLLHSTDKTRPVDEKGDRRYLLVQEWLSARAEARRLRYDLTVAEGIAEAEADFLVAEKEGVPMPPVSIAEGAVGPPCTADHEAPDAPHDAEGGPGHDRRPTITDLGRIVLIVMDECANVIDPHKSSWPGDTETSTAQANGRILLEWSVTRAKVAAKVRERIKDEAAP